MNRSRKVWINRPKSISCAMKNTIKHSYEGSCLCYYLCSKCRGADPLLMTDYFRFLCREVANCQPLANFLDVMSCMPLVFPMWKWFSTQPLYQWFSDKKEIVWPPLPCSFFSFVNVLCCFKWEILEYQIAWLLLILKMKSENREWKGGWRCFVWELMFTVFGYRCGHILGGPLKGNQLLPENEVRTQEFWAFGGCSPSRLRGTLPFRG